jgi:hypothetical protein
VLSSGITKNAEIQRVPASYLLVFMISDELRNRKRFAVPIQFIPYKSLGDFQLCELQVKVEHVMKSTGMTVVGKYLLIDNFYGKL